MKKDLGLYVHIPFCIQKCTYCDFLSFSCKNEEKEKYTDALISEIRSISEYTKEHTFSTLYIGGGTPTFLGEENLLKIIDAVKCCFSIEKDAEFTVEANPETVKLGMMKRLYAKGVNRISLGVQSMNDKTLKKINRAHNVLKVLESYAAVTLAGFENVNYDLIFALPDQTEGGFLQELYSLLKLNPKHVSLYSLQLEEGTPLYNNKDKFRFADEDTERSMYYSARKVLEAHGLKQYETSNFAVPSFESRHNERYWECREYIGLGLGASSYFNNVRYENPSDFSEYYEFCENFKPLYEEGVPLSVSEMQSEFFVLGLRKTKGVSFSEFYDKFKVSAEEIFGKQIEKHLSNGLLIKEGDQLFLSERGQDISNTVMCDFLV